MKSQTYANDAAKQSSLPARSSMLQLNYSKNSNNINSDHRSLAHLSILSSGHQLDAETREFMESRIGHDFSQVRIHDNPDAEKNARLMHARAFTLNNHIFFGMGEYKPQSAFGRKLLAHELVHVVQQRRSGFVPQNTPQFWGAENHQKLTREGVRKVMTGFNDLEIDPQAMSLLARYSTEMDTRWPELWFNIGGAAENIPIAGPSIIKPIRGNISEYYRRHQERALNHGEGGLYELSKQKAEHLNATRQYNYGIEAYGIFRKIKPEFSSFRESEMIKAQARNAVFSKLGDALHVAQDRGAHGEGAAGFGHSRKGFDPDSPSENSLGFEEARKNTESILRYFDGILNLMLHMNWMRHHTITRPAEVEIKPRLKELSSVHYQDKYEQEADSVAEQVVARPMPFLHGKFKPTLHDMGNNFDASIRNADMNPSHPSETFRIKEPLIRKGQLSGECGTIIAPSMDRVLLSLGSAQPLPSSVRHEMESLLGADFGNVSVHIGPTAERIAEMIESRAFNIRDHIAFGHGAYQPYSSIGRALLIHELDHVKESHKENDRLHGWFSRRLNPGKKLYLLGDKFREYLIASDKDGNTHEEITEQAIAEINIGHVKFSKSASDVILFWVAELDRWKTVPIGQTLSDLARKGSFPELKKAIDKAGGISQAVGLLHAYKGARPDEIGFRGSEPTGQGIAGALLDEAIRNYMKGRRAHGLYLLGMSLHTIQDFFAHNYPLVEKGQNLRQLGAWQGGNENKDILEDDPNLPSDRSRWKAARTATREILEKFYSHFMQRIEIP
jgi:hypothetical protein